MKRTTGVLLAGIVGLAVQASTGHALVFGPEFQVNTYTTSYQGGPRVAADASGNFVVVWQSDQDGSSLGIFGQRYDSSGAALGTEFQVNIYTTSFQGNPAIASDASGNFVVVWYSDIQDGSSTGVFGQRYDNTGNPLGTEFQVNSYTTSSQFTPAIAADATGNFVVVWGSYPQDGSNAGVFGQRYDSAGNPLGTEFQVNSYTTSYQQSPSVGLDGSGNFVVVWQAGGGLDGSGAGVAGQRYDSSGNPVGTEFVVNTYTTSFQSAPSVAVHSSGDFVVVWNSYPQDGAITGVFGQRYDSAGNAAGTEFQVNSYTTGSQYAAGYGRSVIAEDDGGFVVAWSSQFQDGSSYGAFGRRYDSSGNPVGTEFQINSYTTAGQYGVSLAARSGNDFVVAWGSNSQDGSDYGVFARVATDTTTTTTTSTTTSTTTLPPTTTTSTTTTSTTSTTSTTTSSTTTSTTLPFTCGAAPEPDGSCNLADPSGTAKSSVQITDDDSDPARDQFKWKWNKGVAVGIDDFADPDTSMNTYRVCIYDTTGLLRELDLPPGGIVATCGTQPCWKPSGTTGYKYKNTAGMPDGITGAKLKSGTAGKSQVQIKAKGTSLAPPPTAALSNVVVQLLIDDGVTTECFKTSFPNGGITLQNDEKFKAKGP